MKTYLLLGSNVGDRLINLATARKFISERIDATVQESAVYETAPWGNLDQPAFLNQVIQIDSDLKPESLLAALKSIETLMGRKQLDKWGPRLIDIDILLMEDVTYDSASLTVPHPQLPNRRFTLMPLAEIAPDVVHPLMGITILNLLTQCSDKLEVHIFPSIPVAEK